MSSLKKYCEKNGLDENKTFNMIVGQGGGILPQKVGMQGYIAEITDTSIICTNDKLKVKKEIPFTSFTSAEFGIGSAQLWLQCIVDGAPFVFCSPRRDWKDTAGKLLLEKIGEQTEIKGWKEYNGYTGKLFFLYMWK